MSLVTPSQRAQIVALVKKAADAHDPVAAINFSQAACNAAKALLILEELDRRENWG